MRKILSSFLAMICFVIAGEAQVLTISGKVADEKGVPIPSASVVIKGKTGTGVLLLMPRVISKSVHYAAIY